MAEVLEDEDMQVLVGNQKVYQNESRRAFKTVFDKFLFFFLIKRLEFEWLLREHVPKVLIQLGNILQVNLNSNTPPASPCSHFV